MDDFSYNPNPDEIDFSYEMGRLFGKKFRRKLRHTVKAAVDPRTVVRMADKATHGKHSPIRALEEGAQRGLGKYMPITKPFIAIHKGLAAKTHESMEKTGFADKHTTPQKTAARLALSRVNGENALSTADHHALQDRGFRMETLAHLLAAARRGNGTAKRAITLLRYGAR